MAVKSTGDIDKLVPHSAVPAFPGAINSLSHKGLLLILSAKTCSLPPLPRIKIFILQNYTKYTLEIMKF
jgi:hypothetical protein